MHSCRNTTGGAEELFLMAAAVCASLLRCLPAWGPSISIALLHACRKITEAAEGLSPSKPWTLVTFAVETPEGAAAIAERLKADTAPMRRSNFEILKYKQSTSKEHAKALHNLVVSQSL